MCGLSLQGVARPTGRCWIKYSRKSCHYKSSVMCTYIQGSQHTCTHTHTHARTHTRTHTHTHTHTHTILFQTCFVCIVQFITLYADCSNLWLLRKWLIHFSYALMVLSTHDWHRRAMGGCGVVVGINSLCGWNYALECKTRVWAWLLVLFLLSPFSPELWCPAAL